MSAPKWTPGPWALGSNTQEWAAEPEEFSSFQVQPIGALGREDPVCLVVEREVRGNADAIDANARLIAAAPELYATALAAKDYLIGTLEEPGRTVFWDLVAALKKAADPA